MNVADYVASVLEIAMILPVLSMAFSESRPGRMNSAFLAICLAGFSVCLYIMDAPNTAMATVLSAILWGYIATRGGTNEGRGNEGGDV